VTESLQLDISMDAAALVAELTPRELRLKTAKGEITLDGGDLGSVLLFLCHDSDHEISSSAINSIRELSGEHLLLVLNAPGTHSYMLEILSRLHFKDLEIADLIALHPAVSIETLEFLAMHGVESASELYAAESYQSDLPEGEEAGADELEPDEVEYMSKYQLAQSMGVAEKIKMAMTGDKEWRGILLKDSNKLVSGGVIKNPRITDSEVLAIAKSAVQNDEIIRAICSNKEWVKNYNIRRALVENSKTPLPNALRFMTSLGEKDMAALAKSKNVSSVISTQAKRLIMNKNKK